MEGYLLGPWGIDCVICDGCVMDVCMSSYVIYAVIL